jgi:release factor glutamine methyltransferase
MNIDNAISQATLILKKNNIRNPKLDTEILMSSVIGKDRKFVILNSKKKIEKLFFDNFKRLIDLRAEGKPIAYIIKKKSFWKDEFELNNDVLIPRPDTEIIVEETLKVIKNKSNLSILDIGVGSGCILLSLLREKKNCYGVGIDMSKKCIDLCKKNSLRLNLNKRVKFFKSDVDNFCYGKYDLIVSNPPYIKRNDLKYLERDVKDFEPKIALDGGLDGLSEIRKVVNKSSELIKKNGKLILEIGFDQKKEVKKILINKGFYINKTIKDYSKNDRCIVSTKI